MDSQKALPSIFLLLLLLQLQGSFSHPLEGPRQVRELPEAQELLDRLRDTISVLEKLDSAEPEQRKQETQGEIRENRKPEEQPVPEGSRVSRIPSSQAQENTKVLRESGCFGRKLDRIGSFSNLGCNAVSRRN